MPNAPLSLQELKDLLRQTDPGAVLVPPRVLIRLIQEIHKLHSPFIRVPHVKSQVIDRHLLFRYVEQEELDLESDRLLPETVILLARPSGDGLNQQERGAALLKYWARLFHANVHLELNRRFETGGLTPEAVHERIARIGASEFTEIRSVLRDDHLLLPNASDREVYTEFAAEYLTLKYFRANLRAAQFPAVREFGLIDELLAQDVNAAELFARTRVAGADDPVSFTDNRFDESNDYFWRLVRHAERASARGNAVGAAVLRTRAARVAPADLTVSARDEANADLGRLAGRLQAALKLTDDQAAAWKHDLPLLLEKADQGTWTVEAGLLYDLQKVCIDHERDVSTLDVVEWFMSAGRRPIKRPLPGQRMVRTIKHLRRALQRLPRIRVTDADRLHLTGLIEHALRTSEERLQERFRPILSNALLDVGLRPANPPEQAAFQKILDELLERITSYGFLTFSDLRDALSRNTLKLPDMTEPVEFVRGDPLLRLDRRLSTLLDGVYRRSEFLSRWMERLTALNFGTHFGRWLTRYLTVPFGAAFVILLSLELLSHEVTKFSHWAAGPTPGTSLAAPGIPLATPMAAAAEGTDVPAPAARPGADGDGAPARPALGDRALHLVAAAASTGGPVIPPGLTSAAGPLVSAEPPTPEPHGLTFDLVGPVSVLVLGSCLFAAMHVPAVRRQIRRTWSGIWHAVHLVFVDVPARIWRIRLIRAALVSWPAQLSYFYLFKPLVVCVPIWWRFPEAAATAWNIGLTLLVVNFALNSRLGQAVSQATMQVVVQSYNWLRAGLVSGVLGAIARLFKRLIEAMEYLFYTVDEWLRFRGGDSRLAMLVRMVAGVVWFPFSYLARLYMIVLIEPGLNPLKLPVVLVAGKVLVPLTPAMAVALAEPLTPILGSVLANVFAGGTVWLLPDAFGFLFWETKENWSLYRANRPRQLEPVVIGHHGETMLQLLRPGFHSGTLPHLFAQLRRAERRAYATGTWREARLTRQRLQEVEHCLRAFIQHQLINLLGQSRGWHEQKLTLARTVLASNQVRFGLCHQAFPGELLWVRVELCGDRLVAQTEAPAWLKSLTIDQSRALTTALAGLYKLAGVDLVREQIEACLAPMMASYRVAGRHLVVALAPGPEHQITFDLDEISRQPRHQHLVPNGSGGPSLLEPSQLIFSAVPVPWLLWVSTWQQDVAGRGHPRLFEETVSLLPAAR